MQICVATTTIMAGVTQRFNCFLFPAGEGVIRSGEGGSP